MTGSVTPAVCVCVRALCTAVRILSFDKWDQRRLCYDDSEHQSSESLTMHELLSQA